MFFGFFVKERSLKESVSQSRQTSRFPLVLEFPCTYTPGTVPFHQTVVTLAL